MWDLIGKLIEKLNCINNTRRIETLEKKVENIENKMDHEYYTKEWVDKLNEDNEKAQYGVERAISELTSSIKDNHNVLIKKYDKSDERITNNAVQLSSIQTAINMMNGPILVSNKNRQSTNWKP
jgi:polyhydroxyalkanoate synthesis regulator phasin